ncbi:hypothetical protein [Hyphomicrobium sp.]|uniref:hypothetical protein n=1 Tax=Hyphomicrobium sp. TaxID=82 RepID=UPI002D790B66|nr:hypothetical protein [Hyphomicrobium sp.]HET6388226.1 hypothetical protein [Hyphomicrobium sp.]
MLTSTTILPLAHTMYDQVRCDGIPADQFIVAEAVPQSLDDVLAAVPFEIDGPTLVMPVKLIPNPGNGRVPIPVVLGLRAIF